MKGYLLDTNVLCEGAKKAPDQSVIAWLAQSHDSTQYVSVLTLGEVQRGVSKSVSAVQRKRLAEWLRDGLLREFEGRVLPVDWPVAEAWALLTAKCEAHGRPLPAIDALLAATALVHDLTVVTRNSRDFAGTGVRVLNPWKD